MKKHFFYLNTKKMSSELTYEKLLSEDFELDLECANELNHLCFLSELIKKVINSTPLIHTDELDINERQIIKVSPDYKLAWITLYKLNIIKPIIKSNKEE